MARITRTSISRRVPEENARAHDQGEPDPRDATGAPHVGGMISIGRRLGGMEDGLGEEI